MKVVLIQMQSGSSVETNLHEACRFIEQSVAQHQPELIVFPENFLCMGSSDYPGMNGLFQKAVMVLKRLAKQHAVAMLLGSIPFPSMASQKKCYSRSMLIDKQGETLGAYDKVHLFDVTIGDEQKNYRESDVFEAGKKICVLPLAGHMLGLSICYDLRFPILYQRLRGEGAEILAVPSAFTYKTGQAHWLTLLKARAIETQCFVLAANQCGEHPHASGGLPRKTWGHSAIIDPWGEVLCELDNQPGLCAARLDFEKMKQIRQSMPVFEHQRSSI